MDKNTSLKLSGYISQAIINEAPKISYSKKELEREKKKYPPEQLEKLKDEGYFDGDFEKFFVIKKLCDKLNIWDYADEEYLKKLFKEAKKLDKKSFCENEYLKRALKDNKKTPGENI